MNGLVDLKGRRTGVHWGPGRARGGSQRELGMVPWTIRGVLRGSPGEEVMAIRLKNREGRGAVGRGAVGRGAVGRGGGGAAGEVGIMRKTGVKDGVRTGCEKRKILTSPSPYPFLMSNQS